MNTDFSYCNGSDKNKQCIKCKRYIVLYDERLIPEMLWYVEVQEKNCINFINIK